MEPKKIYQQMLKVQAEIDAITKDRTNTQGQGYKFRGIDDVYNELHTIFAKHDVFSVPNVLSKEREERQSKSGGTLIYTILTVRYTFFASDGSSVDAVTIGEAMDSGDKSCNKAMSAAHKYCLLQTFSIPTSDDKDTENQTHEIKPKPPVAKQPGGLAITDKQRKAIWASLKDLGYDTDGMKKLQSQWTGKQSSSEWTREDVDKVFKGIASLKSNNPQLEEGTFNDFSG